MAGLPDGFVLDAPPKAVTASIPGLPEGFVLDTPPLANPPLPPERPASFGPSPLANPPLPPERPASFGPSPLDDAPLPPVRPSQADLTLLNSQAKDADAADLKSQLPGGDVVQWGDKFYNPGNPTPIGSVPSLSADQGAADKAARLDAATKNLASVSDPNNLNQFMTPQEIAAQGEYSFDVPADTLKTRQAAAVKVAKANLDALQQQPIPQNNPSTDLTNRALKGAGQSALDVAKPFGQIAADLGAPGLQNGLQKAEGALPQTDPIRDKDLSAQVASGIGGAAPFVAGGVLGAGIKTLGAAGALQGFGSQYDAAQQAGSDKSTQYAAGTLGLLTGAAQSLPIARLFEEYAPGSSSRLANMGRQALQGAIEFPAIQSAVTIGNNAIAQGLYDKNRDLFDGVKENAEAAALVGAFLGFGAGMHNTAEGRAKIAAAAENFDWANTLGVKPNASPAEVKAAYYAKAKEVHPDNGGSTEAMQAVNAAYEIYKAKQAKENPQSQPAPAPDQPQGQSTPEAPQSTPSGAPQALEPPGSATFARGPSDQAPPPAAAAPPPPAPPSPAPPSQGAAPSPQREAEHKTLVQAGYDDEDIAGMSPKERAKAVKDALTNGIPLGGDTGDNIPESPATLQAQQQQLVGGDRPVVMYPKGTPAPAVPDGMKQIVTPRGTFHYNPDQITPQQIKKASAQGRENEILGLGPFNKDDVAKAAQPGEQPQAVVERAPDGTEVRAAAGVAATIPQQQAAMEQGKSPGNTITVEPIQNVLGPRAQVAPPPGFVLDAPPTTGDIWSNQVSPSSPESSLPPSSSQALALPSSSGSSSEATRPSASSTATPPNTTTEEGPNAAHEKAPTSGTTGKEGSPLVGGGKGQEPTRGEGGTPVEQGKPEGARTGGEGAATGGEGPVEPKASAGEGTWYHTGWKDFTEGRPRALPSYFTKPSKNSREWLRGYDSAKKAGAKPAAVVDYKALGKAAHGQDLELDDVPSAFTPEQAKDWREGWQETADAKESSKPEFPKEPGWQQLNNWSDFRKALANGEQVEGPDGMKYRVIESMGGGWLFEQRGLGGGMRKGGVGFNKWSKQTAIEKAEEYAFINHPQSPDQPETLDDAVEALFGKPKPIEADAPKPAKLREPEAPIAPETPVEKRIREAFFKLSGRPAQDNLRFSALRKELSDIPRADLDAALWSMREKKTAQISRLDNPRDIQAEADSALSHPDPRRKDKFHYLWISPEAEAKAIQSNQPEKPDSSEPAPATPAKPTSPFKASASLVDAVADHLTQGNSFPNIIVARKFAKDNGGEGLNQKQIEEAIEHGIVKAARHYVEKAKDPDQAYRDLTALYERQPILGTRTSDSVAMQAYSTPAPLAYLAAHLAGIGKSTTVFEPSAGNGMLLITANPKNVIANELSSARAATLKEQGIVATERDAADIRTPRHAIIANNGKPFDAVIANPPFGVIKNDEGQSTRFDLSDIQPGYKTNEIDHAIALRALTAMKPDGHAVLILGGINKLVKTGEGRSDAYNGKAKREFYKTLYDNYRVVDHFTAAGELYAKQGAGYPVDVIVIDGRGKSSLPLPSVSAPKVYNSWDELKEKLDAPRSGNEAAIDGSSGGNAGEPSARAAATANEPHPEPVSARPEPEAGKPEPVRSGRADEQPGKPVPVSDDAGQSRVSERDGGSDTGGIDSEAPAKPRNRVAKKAEQETETQVAYRPKSSHAEALGTLVPTNMRFATEKALDKVAVRHKGGIEKLVGDRIGFKTDENGPYFVADGARKYPLAAEQLDAAALAIDNMEKGSGFIIGDQTGIGKGRVNAAVIRYALKQGLTPIFVTAMPNLYADMYRDLTDMGIQQMLGREPNILMTNSGETVPLDDEGKLSLKTADSAKHGELLRQIAADGNLKNHDALFTTYSQMQTVQGASTDRQRLLRALAPHAILILDEAHNAGGTGEDKNAPPNRAQFVRELVQAAKGVFYSSATYAKRPDVMDLYSKTDMAKAVKDLDELGPTITAGGVPMQQAVAAMLAEAGQYIRRERSFAGISYDTPLTPVDRHAYDHVSKSLAAVHRFSERMKAATKEINKELRADAKAISADGSTGGAGAASLNFTSIMHNLINQTLLGLKAVPAAQETIAAIERGEKPILTVANTMESFLNEYAADNGIRPGDPVALTFNDLLHRYLDRTRTITIKKPFMAKGEKGERKYLSDAELGSALAAYKAASKIIHEMDLSSIPISPIDFMKHEIEKAGYRTGEITGRGQTLDYSTTPPTYTTRPQSERSIKGRRATISGFNNGPIDTVVLNQAGATGLSMHASVNFKDQRQRHMILVQPEGNIDTHMQMLGRPNRTGQVIVPRYTQLVADIPAEKRPAAVLAKKMASLNASTTASRDGALTSKDTPDFMNQYGDAVAAALMMENPDLARRLGDPISEEAQSIEGAMRAVTGRVPLLPIKEQEQVYDLLEESYKTLLAEKEQAGENALEAKRLDLDAKILSSKEVVNGSGDSPFTRPVIAETVDAKRQGKPYKGVDVVADALKSLAEIRGSFAAEDKDALPQIAAKGGEQASRMGRAALDAFKGYSKDLLGAFENPESRAKAQERFDANETRFRTLIDKAHVGAQVTIKMPEENLTGVITRLFKSGDAQNPLALGSWKINIAVPGQSPVSFSFSKLFSSAARPENADDLYELASASHENPTALLARFDAGAANMREKRVVLTGNILSAFNYAKGQIVNFTDDKGNVRQGVLMPKNFSSVEDLTKGRPTALKTASEVLDYLNSGGLTAVSDRTGEVTLTRQRDGRLSVTVPSSKSDGGKYFLNKGIMAATEESFIKRGPFMRAETPRYGDRAGNDLALVDALIKAGAKFQKPPETQATRSPSVDLGGDLSPRDIPDARAEQTRAVVDKLIDDLLPKGSVKSEVHERLLLTNAERAAAGVNDREALGSYDAKNKIVQISMQAKRPDAVSVHELYHAARDLGLANEQEARVLKRDMPRLRRFLETMFPGKDWASQPDHEIEAYAAQAYWQALQSGTQVSLHTGIRKVFQRFFDFTNRLWSFAHGDGFQMPEDVFGRFASGGWKDRAPGDSQFPAGERAPAVGMGGNPLNRSNLDKIIEHTQDLSRPVKRLQEEMEQRRGGAFSDAADFYASKRLYIGRMTAQSRDFERDHVKPLFKAIAASGLSREEVSKGIYALAAPERNAYIASINPAFPDGGSGMTNAEAAQIESDLAADPQKYMAFQGIARRFAEIRDFDLDNRVAQGLMTQDQADEWRAIFPNYAPMRGFDIPREGEDGPRFPPKFDVWGKESKHAFGRKSRADDPVANMIQQAYQGIDRGERNHYLQALYRALNTLKREGVDVSDIVKITKSEPYKYLSKATGQVTTGYRPIDKIDPDVVTLKIGGREISMKWRDPELAQAIQRMRPDDVHWLANKVLTIQNQVKSFWTHYSPDFIIRHFLFRYPIEGMLNFQELKDVSDKASTLRFIKDTFGSVGDLMKVLHGGQGSAKYDAYIREMREQGGIVEFRQMQSLDLIKHDLERAMMDISKPRQKLRDMREAFDRLTNAMDNAIRLASYIQHREAGFTPKKAALKARDATIDYMLKGKSDKLFGLWFPFHNVATQTGHRFYSANKRSKTIRRTTASLLLAGAALALWNYWAGGTDKRGTPNIEAVPEWERRMNIIVMNPFDKDEEGRPQPIKIPLPYSHAMPFSTGGNLISSVMRQAGIGKLSDGKIIKSEIHSLLEAFTPFGEEDSLLAKAAPSLLKPAVHIATNTRWTGTPIYRDAPRFPGHPVPANSEQGGFNVEAPYKTAAKAINSATGGNAYRPGSIDPHPESIKEFVDEFFGAQIRLAERGIDLGRAAVAKMQGENIPAPARTEIPLLRVVNGQNYDASDRAAYYDERGPAYAAENEVKGLQQSGDSKGADAAFKAHEQDFEAASIFHAADHQRAGIYKQIEALEKNTNQPMLAKQREFARLRQQELTIMNDARVQLNALRASYDRQKP